MKIVLATPLYPPDTEPTALYCELAKRLGQEKHHQVTIVTYGAPRTNTWVAIIAVDKNKPLSYESLILR